MNHCCQNTALSLPQSCTEVVRCSRRLRRRVHRSQLLQNLTILYVKSHSILNVPPELQVLSVSPGNALAESESTLLSFRGAWENLEFLGCTGAVNRSVWELCMWLLDLFTFC